MSNYDFTSKESYTYTNLRNHGLFIKTHKPSAYPLMLVRQAAIMALCEIGNLKSSCFSTYVLTDAGFTSLEFPEYALFERKALIVLVESKDKEIINNFINKVAVPRQNMHKHTFIVLDEPDNESICVTELASLLSDNLWDDYIEKVNNEYENICFLDIDGVLTNNKETFLSKWQCTHAGEFLEFPVIAVEAFDQGLLMFLRRLSAQAKVKFVLSSQWRVGMTDFEIKSFGRYLGLPIISKVINGGKRDIEIKHWINTHNPTGRLCLIDDENINIEGVQSFKTSTVDGASWNVMSQMAKYFGVNIYDLNSLKFKYMV